MVEKIYIVHNGEVFYGNAVQFDDCFMFMAPEEWNTWDEDELQSYFSRLHPNMGDLVIIEGERITREQFDAMSIVDGNQAILDQMAAAKEK